MQTCEADAACSSEVIRKMEFALEAALKEIFLTMLNTEAEVIAPALVTDTPRISSMVGFTGKMSGLLCIHLGGSQACNVASGLLGMPIEAVDETVRDAVGELGNMLAGSLKKKLSETDNMFQISIPSVIEGSEYSMHLPANSHQMWIGVAAGNSRFKVHLVLQQQ